MKALINFFLILIPISSAMAQDIEKEVFKTDSLVKSIQYDTSLKMHKLNPREYLQLGKDTLYDLIWYTNEDKLIRIYERINTAGASVAFDLYYWNDTLIYSFEEKRKSENFRQTVNSEKIKIQTGEISTAYRARSYFYKEKIIDREITNIEGQFQLSAFELQERVLKRSRFAKKMIRK